MASGPIQVSPSGLLGFLNLKNSGRNPDVLNESVQPTMDLREWYFETSAQVDSTLRQLSLNVGAAATLGFYNYNNIITVPQNQWWYVTRYSIQAVVQAATDAALFSPAFLVYPGTASTVHILAPDVGTGTGPTRRPAYAEDFWLPPGSQLGVYVAFAGGTNPVQFTGTLIYSTLPI